MTPLTLLIVDNDPQLLSSLAGMCKDEPYICHFLRNENEALDFLDKEDVHILLAELKAQGADNTSLLRQVQRQHPGIIRLAMSGTPDPKALFAAFNEEIAHRYLVKPLDRDEFRSIIKQAVALCNRQQEQRELIARLREDNQQLHKQIEARNQQLLIMENKAYIGNHALQVVHNLNSSLNNILNSLEIIESILTEHHPNLSELVEFCSNAKCSALDLKKIIAEILVHGGDQRKHRSERVDINQIIQRENKFFSIDPLYKYEIDKQLELRENLPSIWANPIHLKQIIDNLIKNSIDAEQGSPVKRLKIETGLMNQKVFMRISDTGEGISQANLEKIFLPDFTTKPPGKGTGLGLASVKNLVEANYGEISVESTEGKGTVVTVKLPVDRRDLVH